MGGPGGAEECWDGGSGQRTGWHEMTEEILAAWQLLVTTESKI